MARRKRLPRGREAALLAKNRLNRVKGDELKDTSSIAGKDAMRPWK